MTSEWATEVERYDRELLRAHDGEFVMFADAEQRIAELEEQKNIIGSDLWLEQEKNKRLRELCEKAYMRLYGNYGADGCKPTRQEDAMQDASLILDEALGNKFTGTSEPEQALGGI